MGTWGLMEFQKCVPYVVRKRWSSHCREKNGFYKKNAINGTFPETNTLSRILSHRCGYYFIDIFSNEMWMAVSINEASSTAKRMKFWVLCVFKVLLTIYPWPDVRRRSNMKVRVQNGNPLFTNGTRNNVIYHSINVFVTCRCSNNSLIICGRKYQKNYGARFLLYNGPVHALLVSPWDYVFARLPWTFPLLRLYHFIMLFLLRVYCKYVCI